jgi:hypothetical protein
VIEDLDGMAVEPARRGHVIVLSAATAAVAIAPLVALVVPPLGGSVAEAPSAAPSASNAPTMTIVSGGTAGIIAGSGRVTLDQLPARPGSPLMCAAPRPDGWGPIFVLGGVSYAVSDSAGRALPPPASVPLPLSMSIYDRSGGLLLYRCAEPDAFTPRIDLSNITP